MAARAEPDPPTGALPKDLDGVVGEFGGEVPTEARGEGGEAEVAPLIAYLLVFQTFLRGFANVLFTFWRLLLGSIETDFRNYGPTNHGGGAGRQAGVSTQAGRQTLPPPPTQSLPSLPPCGKRSLYAYFEVFFHGS